MTAKYSQNTAEIIEQIETIEKELSSLKLSLLKGTSSKNKKKIISLSNFLKDIEISEVEIKEAQESLHSKIKP